MKVYLVVTNQAYHYGQVEAVFSTEEAADAWVEEQPDPDGYRVEEWGVE